MLKKAHKIKKCVLYLFFAGILRIGVSRILTTSNDKTVQKHVAKKIEKTEKSKNDPKMTPKWVPGLIFSGRTHARGNRKITKIAKKVCF